MGKLGGREGLGGTKEVVGEGRGLSWGRGYPIQGGGAWVELSLWQLRSQSEGVTTSLVRSPANGGRNWGHRGRDRDGAGLKPAISAREPT